MNSKKVFKNVFVLGISQFISKLLLFVFTVYIARYLKESGFGQYSLVVTIVGFFNIFTDFGLGTIAFREVSKNYTEANKYFNNILFLRICLAVVSFLFLIVTVNLLHYPPTIKLAIYIYGVTLFTTNIIELSTSIFNAFEKMEYIAVLKIFLSALTLAMGIFVLKSGYGLVALVLISVIAGVLTVVLGFLIAKGKMFINISSIDIVFCKKLIRNSFPLMLLGFIGVIYFRIDIVLLSKMKGDADVGLYTVAYKLMDTFMIISNSIVGATFPYLSRYFKTSFENLSKLFRKLSGILFILGILFAVIVFVLSKQIIVSLFGSSFINSASALRILIWTVPLIYINAVLLYTLIAANQQLKITIIIGIVALVNVVLNIIVIPQYSYIGSSFVTVISELLVFCGYYYLVKKNLALSFI